ncbi:MAG: single-stranded DNA-binding protein [Clostridia bacterium]|nr:single-stranded DNA-binding protein [Clostridia bacterium]
MNKIFIVGNLTADPELRATPNGASVCTFTVAVDRRFQRGNNGEKTTDFFRINAWRQLGENCSKFLAKGRKVAVIGELQARTYQDRNGETRMSLDVSADEVEFLSPKGDGGSYSGNGGGNYSGRTNNQQNRNTDDFFGADGFTDIQSDDIPF